MLSPGYTSGYTIGYLPRINSLGGAVGSGMDNVLHSSVVAHQLDEAYAAVYDPSQDIGYFPECRWCPLTTYVPDTVAMTPVTASREQAIGTSAVSTDTHSDTAGRCTDQLVELIGSYKLLR